MRYDDDARLAAACVLGSFAGTEAPDWLLRHVADGLGGVLLFAQNIVDDDQTRRLCVQLHATSNDVVIAIDEEGGDVTRLDAADGSDTPCAAAFAAVDDERLTHAAFRDLGHRLRLTDIDLTLAPCADINSNPANPIIGVRAFGSTAELAATHSAACIAGFQEAGVRTCVKHFPGHGDTSADTHVGHAAISGSLNELRERELVPFAAAIRDGVEAVLTAHIVAEALDDRPASLSAAWTEYLRGELGFDGVIITDALDMGAISGGRGAPGVADAAVVALAAGADFLCLGSNFDEETTDLVVTTIRDALHDGQLSREALATSAKRIRGLRLNPAFAAAEIAAGRAAAEVAERAVTITGNLPVGPFRVVECRPEPSMACFNVTWGLARHVTDLGWPVRLVQPGTEPTIDTDLPLVVVVRDAAVHIWQNDVVEMCVRARPDTVVVELGWPSPTPPSSNTYIVSHGAARSSTRAVAALLSQSLTKEA
jgi:beta-N-acetylhexosaminidase